VCDDGNAIDDDDCNNNCQEPADICMVIIDEEGVDNDFLSVETAASYCGTLPDLLVNDQGTASSSDLPMNSTCSSRELDSSNDLPVECGNPPFEWNKRAGAQCGDVDGPGNLALMPTGQVDDEGWFAPPPPVDKGGFLVIEYADDRPSYCDRYSSGQSESIIDPPTMKDGYDLFIEEFAAGVIRQDCLDKVKNVMPLRSQDLIALVGRTCVAIVYDSDLSSTNYHPLYTSLQGRRDGAFSFTVEAYEVPGSLPESGSSTSLVDLWLRIEEPLFPDHGYEVTIRDHEPDSIAITKAKAMATSTELTVYATSDFAPGAHMTVSVDGPDYPKDPNVDPYIVEGVMDWNSSTKRYEFTASNGWGLGGLIGRRIVISTDEGGSYVDKVRAGNYQSRLNLMRELRRRFYERLKWQRSFRR
jgi:hypothetical protein